MLIFATSDKGGTGRSVTSCNVLYRRALQGSNVVYLDCDFGSPTSGAIFNIASAPRGLASDHQRNIGGLHSYLRGSVSEPTRLDIWSESERGSLRGRPDGAGQLVLYPGDRDGGEFSSSRDILQSLVQLLLRLEEEFDICLLDLSAGRSYATDMMLAATAHPALRQVEARWLVFHRWTRQHIIAANGLVRGDHGLIATGVRYGHDYDQLTNAIRYVRTAVVDPRSESLAGLRAEQVAWLHECNHALQELAGRFQIGRTTMIGTVPLDPLLQWKEQLISDTDTFTRQIANQATVEAFTLIAKRLDDDQAWAGL